MNLGRRGMLGGLLLAPAIIRTPNLLMPISTIHAGTHMQFISEDWGGYTSFDAWSAAFKRHISDIVGLPEKYLFGDIAPEGYVALCGFAPPWGPE